MLKVVVYGAAPDDTALLSPLSDKIDLVLELEPLNDDNFHPDAEVMVVFANSEVKPRHVTPRLKAIISRTTGIDHIKCQVGLSVLKIPILQAKGYATKSVAEYSLTAIRRELNGDPSSQNVVIIGAGAIGRYLYGLVASEGMRAVMVSASGAPDTESCGNLKQLFSSADFICLHASLRGDNRKIINEESIAHLKPGAILINAARGQMVDNKALLEVLNAGIIRKAYLDLVENDSYAKAVIGHQNVIYTNHSAWKSDESLRLSQEFLVETLNRLAEN